TTHDIINQDDRESQERKETIIHITPSKKGKSPPDSLKPIPSKDLEYTPLEMLK
ncbi:MAG: hypothetical protein Dasosvirus22_4, partial [Dasosvirus sp.]